MLEVVLIVLQARGFVVVAVGEGICGTRLDALIAVLAVCAFSNWRSGFEGGIRDQGAQSDLRAVFL